MLFMRDDLLPSSHPETAPGDAGAGIDPRAGLEKLSALRMVDVRQPTTDARILVLRRYTEPEKGQQLLLRQLRMQLPEQPPPKITSEFPTQTV
jgi:hypothetical protein